MPLPAALQARLKRRGLVVETPKIIEEIKEIERKKKKSYKHQPLPPGWFQVPDTESGHDYYWNVHTNQVAWRHPNDPRTEITYPASWQQKPEKAAVQQQQPVVDEEEEKKGTDDNTKKDGTKQKVKTGKHPSLLKAQRQKEKSAPYRKTKKDDVLDPMDPASYSEISRGTWSSGLRDDSEVNSGVDTTANGPLFQQRPYPSPGDILRRNKGKQKAEEGD